MVILLNSLHDVSSWRANKAVVELLVATNKVEPDWKNNHGQLYTSPAFCLRQSMQESGYCEF
jgi:hypothetical protein